MDEGGKGRGEVVFVERRLAEVAVHQCGQFFLFLFFIILFVFVVLLFLNNGPFTTEMGRVNEERGRWRWAVPVSRS